jgi:hypothetical protein
VKQRVPATAHMADQSLLSLRDVFSEQVIDQQPLCSPYLNLHDFYLWGMLKDEVYVNYLHTAEQTENTELVILDISH